MNIFLVIHCHVHIYTTGPNQVDTFLGDHCGPGIQHIGLHTDNIVDTVANLQDSGVQFAEPPYTYYTEVHHLSSVPIYLLDFRTLQTTFVHVYT